MPQFKDYLHLHFIVLIWGFTAILGLLITIPPVEVVFYRTLIAAIGLAILMSISKESFKVEKIDAVKLLLTGSLIAGHWILFFASARISTASVCLAGMATTSFWTSIVEPLALKTKVIWYEVFIGLLVIFGLYIIFHFEFNHALGLILALISALLAALFTVINSRFAKTHHHNNVTFYEMTGACVSIAIFFPFYKRYFADNQMLQLIPTSMDLLYIAILAIVCTVYAYAASIELMKKISAFSVNLTVNLEPLYGIVLAFIVFGEREKMQAGFYIGASIILLSVLAHPLLNKLYHKKHLQADNLR